VGQEELLFPWKERIGTANDWSQRGGHLQADKNENQRPRFEMTAALFAAETARGSDQAQTKGEAD